MESRMRHPRCDDGYAKDRPFLSNPQSAFFIEAEIQPGTKWSMCPCCLVRPFMLVFHGAVTFHPQDKGEVPLCPHGGAGCTGSASSTCLGKMDVKGLACAWEPCL